MPAPRPLAPRTHDWWGYQRPAEFDVIGTTVDIPMRDGITLSCSLRRPARDGVPVDGAFPGLVVEFTPYVVLADFYAGEADFFVARGYAALVGTMRGVGNSGGRWEHGSFRQGGRDAHDLVEWLAAQEFCDGRVGMFGESFGGQTSYGAALERPAHLRAIAPMQSPGSLYHDVIFPGGVKTTERGEIDSWPDIATMTSGGSIDADAEFAANRAHPTFDEYWRDRAFVDVLDRISLPVLAVGGWNDDYFRSGTLANIEAIPDRTWAIYGSWAHFFPVALSDESTWSTGDGGERDQMLTDNPQLPSGVLLAWFDHWVAGRSDVPISQTPTFVSFEGPVGIGAGWQQLEEWNPPGTPGARWFLDAEGSLDTAAPAVRSVAFRQPNEGEQPVDAVTFTSEPIATDQVLLGHASVSFRAALDAGEAHFFVELLDVAPDGVETMVNDGYLAATHRRSHVDPEPVVIGEFEHLEIGIRAHHHRFGSGHRIRLRISGGPPAKLTAPPTPVTVTIETGPDAILVLPGYGAD